MPHITLPDGLPRILGVFAFRPETAEPIRALALALAGGLMLLLLRYGGLPVGIPRIP